MRGFMYWNCRVTDSTCSLHNATIHRQWFFTTGAYSRFNSTTRRLSVNTQTCFRPKRDVNARSERRNILFLWVNSMKASARPIRCFVVITHDSRKRRKYTFSPRSFSRKAFLTQLNSSFIRFIHHVEVRAFSLVVVFLAWFLKYLWGFEGV